MDKASCEILAYARNRLLEEIHYDEYSADVHYWRGYIDGVIRISQKTDGGDVAEVKHGEWLENGANYKCSVCGNTESYYTDSYCRVCGAKMDGGGE